MLSCVKFGNWQLFLDKTLGECSSECFWDEFKRADLSEKVRMVDSLLNSRNAAWIEEYFKKHSKKVSAKNEEKASEERLKGNKLFQKKEFSKARVCYNQCIKHAVWGDESSQLALGFANRSAAFFHLHQYSECAVDVDNAMRHKFPLELQAKLFVRQAQCYLRLSQPQLAEKAVQKGLRCVEECSSSIEDKEKYKIQLQKCQKDVENCVEKPSKASDAIVPVNGFSEIIEQASSSVKLMYTEEKGRYLQAGQDLNAGDLIIHETPYAAVLLPSFYPSNCQHCFAVIYAPIPCSHCVDAVFCSELCRLNSWTQYHHFECSFTDLLHSIGVAHLALRIILTTSVSELQKFGANEKIVGEEIAGLSDTGVYSRNYAAVFHLLPHNENVLHDDLFQYALTAALLLKCLNHKEYFKEDLPALRFSVGGLLLRHICQLVCNAHAITRLEQRTASQAVVECQQVRIATAIYPTTSLLNHSCDPSIIASFRKNEIFVRLVKDIKAGEEIFTCYGPHYARMAKEQRQEVLMSQYFFACVCCECTADEPLEALLKAYRCQKCSQAIISHGTQEVLKCTKCATIVEMNKLSVAEKQSSEYFMSSLKSLQGENVDNAIENLKKSFKVREMIYHRNHKLLTESKDSLARCYCIKGQFARAVPLLKDCLVSVGTAFGSQSIELANELHKYAEVLVNARKLEEALEAVERSMNILRLNYGPEYSTAHEMEELRSNILKYK